MDAYSDADALHQPPYPGLPTLPLSLASSSSSTNELPSAPSSVRPLRAMLARGAACDTCRARKVKCDASRPYCTPCLKSARGDTSVAHEKCKYEGTSVAAAREAAAAAREAAGGTAVKRKRKSAGAGAAGATGSEDGDAKRGRLDGDSSAGSIALHAQAQAQDEYPPVPSWAPQPQSQPLLYAAAQHAQQQVYTPPVLPNPPALPGYPTAPTEYRPPGIPTRAAPPTDTASGPTVPREVVEGLEGRIAELEHALQHASAAQQQQQPLPAAVQQSAWYASAAAAPHTRSPSFPYAYPALGGASSVGGASGYPGSPYGTGGGLSGFGAAGLGGSPGVSSSLGLLPPISGSVGSPGPFPLPLPPRRGDPSRRSLSALSAAAVSAGMLDEAPTGGAGSWAAASPLSSVRGTGGAAGGAGVSSLRETGASEGSSAGAPGSASTCTSTSGTTPAGAGHSPTEEQKPSTSSYELDEFALAPELYALLHPQYPASLPPISALHHLVTTFFVRATVPATMLPRAGILSSLAFGLGDARWPDEALLHAICAYGASYVSPSSLVDPAVGARRAYWEREGDKSPREYHYRWAKRAIEGSLDSRRARRNMLQVVQAAVLTCYVAYQNAQFTDLWLFAGLALRLCTPLGLNHLDPWDFAAGRCGPESEDWGVRVRFVERQDLLDAPRTVEEHWERATTWWMAFAVDRFASASTDWSTSIDEKDISTHLPCMSPYPLPSLEIDTALGQIPALSITSPTFLDDTSAPIGSLGLYIKATVLLGRVVNYLQRLPRTRCVQGGETCSAIKVFAKARPDFVELDVALSRFKESVGPRLYDAVGDGGIDGFLISAYCIPHVATILLHESFTDRYRDSGREKAGGPASSLTRCLGAAKCVVNAMHVLYGSSYDLGGNDPFLPFCWSVTGRALVRDYATRRLWGDAEGAEAAKGLAESCLSFHEMCKKQGSGIAATLQKTLQRHLDNPDSLLPLDGSEEWSPIRPAM